MNRKAALLVMVVVGLLMGCSRLTPTGAPPFDAALEQLSDALPGQSAALVEEEAQPQTTLTIPFVALESGAPEGVGQELNFLLPPYGLQPGSPAQTSNFLFPEQGCNWTGVGGQAFNRQGEPVAGLVVEMSGVVGGQTVLFLALTGGDLALGPGGYAITLANAPVDTQGWVNLRLYSLRGEQLSGNIPVRTSTECTRSLTLINLVEIDQQVRTILFFPAVFKGLR